MPHKIPPEIQRYITSNREYLNDTLQRIFPKKKLVWTHVPSLLGYVYVCVINWGNYDDLHFSGDTEKIIAQVQELSDKEWNMGDWPIDHEIIFNNEEVFIMISVND